MRPCTIFNSSLLRKFAYLWLSRTSMYGTYTAKNLREFAMTTANRKYKDSVFVDLFSEDEKAKENFLSLYNALHGTHLPLSSPVENIRLDNVMYMNIINDVSCLVDGKIIVLSEHQSTINENMSRQGMYFPVHSLTSSLGQAPNIAIMRKGRHPCRL